MNKIAILSGDGNLPYHIGETLINKNLNIIFLVLNTVINKEKYKNKKHYIIDILSIKKIIKILKQENINKIIFAGSLRRPSIKDLGFDLDTIRVAKNLLLEKKGDNDLLISIKNYFEDKGYQFFNWKKYCPELFSIENYLSKKKPSKLANLNINKAKTIYKYFKNADVGQSVIVQNQLILGIEAIEGTDKLIERCFNYKRKGDRGILVKFSKKNQSNLIDIPLVGLDTIKNIKKFDYEGLVLERDKCLVVDKEKVIDYANKNNIFIKSEVF